MICNLAVCSEGNYPELFLCLDSSVLNRSARGQIGNSMICHDKEGDSVRNKFRGNLFFLQMQVFLAHIVRFILKLLPQCMCKING